MSDPNHSPPDQMLAVELQVLAGQSGQRSWRFTSKYPNSRISVGSDAYCHWQLQATGVAPVHFELSWDGQALWISDVSAPDEVFLNGQRVSGWTQAGHGTHIRFGKAELSVIGKHVSDANEANGQGELQSEATQFVPSPLAGGGQPERPQATGEPPRMLSARTVVVRPDQPAPRVPAGVPAAAPAPAPAAPAPTRSNRPSVQSAVPDLKRYGLHEAKTMLHNQNVPPPGAPPQQAAPAPDAPEAFPKRNSMFMYPPSLPDKKVDKDAPWSKERFKQEAKMWVDRAKARLKTLDMKTWVILGATVAMAAMLIIDSNDEPATPPVAPVARQMPTDDDRTRTRLPPAELLAPKAVAKAERDAANFYTAGSFREAHTLYRRLARTQPDRRVFAMMVDVVERKLKAVCADRGGSACDD